MITAATVTDEQIRELLADLRAHSYGTHNREDIRACIAAQSTTEIVVSSWTKESARARVAELLNARAACDECRQAPIPGPRRYDHHAVSCSKRCRHPNAAPARELGGDAMSCPDCGAVYRPRRAELGAKERQRIPTVSAADVCRRLSTLAAVRHAIPDFDRAFDELVRDARAAIGEQPTISDGPEPA